MKRPLRSLTASFAACAALTSVSAQANPDNDSPFPASGWSRGVSFEDRSYVSARWSGVHARFDERGQQPDPHAGQVTQGSERRAASYPSAARVDPGRAAVVKAGIGATAVGLAVVAPAAFVAVTAVGTVLIVRSIAGSYGSFIPAPEAK
jgi:hypothetical protein